MSLRFQPKTRREFLQGAGTGLGLIAFAGFAPSFLVNSVLAEAPKAEKDRQILVLIQLAGGNDGLNTVVHHQNDNYYRLRPTIGLRMAAGLHALNDQIALNPAMGKMSQLIKEGKMAVVQNVGYPNPNRSHFRSTEIWETASDSDKSAYNGWVGRYFDACCDGTGKDPLAIHGGDVLPQTFQADMPHNIFGMGGGRGGRNNKRGGKSASGGKDETELLMDLNEAPLTVGDAKDPADNTHYLQHTLMDALLTESRVGEIIANYKPSVPYPGTGLGQSLQRIAALISAGLETRVYYATQGGFDTHANQVNRHAQLLGEMSEALYAFQMDLEQKRLDRQVLTMTFSEFGRRPSENSTAGTDHGTSAPLFVMHTGIKQGVNGTPPDLNIRPNDDITFSTDFRQVYSTVLRNFLKADPTKVLGKTAYKDLNFL
ncbi:MAG TPA: twin-arginine translocation pathway signal protein [Opitutae bacterium]|nr:twin-arginine translocation pathway signal protein [Opitutae bacterium]